MVSDPQAEAHSGTTNCSGSEGEEKGRDQFTTSHSAPETSLVVGFFLSSAELHW